MTTPIARTPSPRPVTVTAPAAPPPAPEASAKPSGDVYGYGPLGEQMQPAARERHLDVLRSAYGKREFKALYSGVQKQVLDTLASKAPATAENLKTVLSTLSSSAAAGLSPSNQKLLVQALGRGNFNPTFAASVEKLMSSPAFVKLSEAEKEAVLSQVKNFPNTGAVANLEKLAGKPWFTQMSLEDKQRSLKTVGFMSDPTKGDRTILDNTLNQFLGPDAKFRLEWTPLDKGRWGNATEDGRLQLHPGYAWAGNGPEVNEGLANNIVPHEVNHQLSHYEPGPTAEFLEAEFRGWYVGYTAQHGTPPTREQAAKYFLDSYFNGRGFEIYGMNALSALGNKTEGPKLLEMMSKTLGVKIERDGWMDTLAAFVKSGDPKTRAAPAVAPSGNIDNR